MVYSKIKASPVQWESSRGALLGDKRRSEGVIPELSVKRSWSREGRWSVKGWVVVRVVQAEE